MEPIGGRPLDAGATLDAAFALTRRCFGSLALLTLVIWIPIAVASGAVIAALTSDFDIDSVFSVSRFGTTAAIVAGTSVTGLAVQGVVLVFGLPLAIARARGENRGLRSSIALSLRRSWPLTVASTIASLAFLFGLVTLVLPVLISISWLLIIPVILDEDRSGIEALGRSNELVKGQGRWWATFERYIFGLFFADVVQGVLLRILLGADVLVLHLGPTASIALFETAYVVGATLPTVFTVALVCAIYLDLKARETSGASTANS